MRTAALLLAFITGAPAQQTNAKFSTTFAVEVSFNDTAMAERVQSLFSRELRALGDVSVIDRYPEYTLSVVGVKTALQDGRVAGYAMSIILTKSLDKMLLQAEKYFQSRIKAADPQAPEVGLYVDVMGARIFGTQLVDATMHVGSLGDLEGDCKEIVSKIDVKTLEPARAAWVPDQKAGK